jgi:hypothetical protein
MIPTVEAVPDLPVTQATSRSVKKAAKSWSTGRWSRLKLNGPNVKFRTAQRAQKTPISAMSAASKYVLALIFPLSNTFSRKGNTGFHKNFMPRAGLSANSDLGLFAD